jgi:hypothetical protein
MKSVGRSNPRIPLNQNVGLLGRLHEGFASMTSFFQALEHAKTGFPSCFVPAFVGHRFRRISAASATRSRV